MTDQQRPPAPQEPRPDPVTAPLDLGSPSSAARPAADPTAAVHLDPWSAPQPGQVWTPGDSGAERSDAPPPNTPPPNTPPPNTPDPGSWTFLDVLAGLGLVLLLSSLLAWPFQVWGTASPLVVLVVAGFLPIWLGLMGSTWWAVRRRGTGNWRFDLGLRIKPVDLAIGLGVGLGCRVAAGVIFLVSAELQGGEGEGNLEAVSGGLSDAALWFVLIGAVTLVAPLVEEIFFRGLLLRSLGSTMVRTRPQWSAARRRQVACLVSATLFTIVHLTELTDPLSVVPSVLTWFGLGYVCAHLTLSTGRLGPAIMSHLVFNGIPAVVLLSM